MNNKALGAVVSSILLLGMTIIAVVSFQTWFNNYQSSNFSDIETKTNSLTDISIEGILGGTMYVKGSTEIQSVFVNGNNCHISGVIQDTINSLPFSDCVSQGENEIVIVTNQGIISKQLFLENYVYSSACPQGYIIVPGNLEFGTKNFCVMAYEAKNVGGVATSQEDLTPWATVSLLHSRTQCANLGSKYSLITNNQWMTIARNIERVDSNWVDGTGTETSYGVGAIKQGNVGSTGIAGASYDGPNPEFGSGRSSLAFHNLSNGEIIWDLGGNVAEWTNDTLTTNQSALGQSSNGYYEWTTIDGFEFLKPGNSSFDSTYGIGTAGNDVDDPFPSVDSPNHGLLRGGAYGYNVNGGIYSTTLFLGVSAGGATSGFRCSYSP